MANLVGWQRNFVFAKYGDQWKARARIFQQNYNTSAMPKHRPKLLKTTQHLLLNFLTTPEDFMKHIRYHAGSSILGITFGIEVRPDNDPYVKTAEKALQSLAKIVNVGAYAVNFVPFLRHLPAWLPGMHFKREAAEWYDTVSAMFDGPYTYVKKDIAAGEMNTSIVASLLRELDDSEKRPETETIIREAFGTAYTGGADTTYSSLNTFILAMLKFPDVQRKAQQELDRVVGHERLPDFGDRDSLPYITAVVKEALRWIMVAPLAAPHRLMVDDEYEGYHLPAGSLVIGNSWAILHDETRYPNPDAFVPERYLTPDGKLDASAPDPSEACFGYGRRMCPGRYFALDSIWIVVASLVAVFNIEEAVDASGAVVEPSLEYTSGTVCYPLPYQAAFKPRHPNAVALIKDSVVEDM
ncbi:cytochrome P450 [Phanerochaete sordida]|uniref:Cytochrome P450 n=1 Tax=Phanerochaete sordida TaxID=48140 RepID=A0A9P3GNG0_9APHY|nr:cytochrome P450 [Phanerochaete sordida]